MGTKSEELKAAAQGRGCLGRAADDEPLFVLRAQDKSAPYVVRHWAACNKFTLDHAMERWPTRRDPT